MKQRTDPIHRAAREDVIMALREAGVRLCNIRAKEVNKSVDKLMADPQYVASVKQWLERE